MTTADAPPTPVEPTIANGPNPGAISIANQYTFEQNVRQMLRENGCDPAREDSYRIQGVQLIDNVREALQLPVKTFVTASTYYHKFRMCHRDAEYNYQDAALASLFVACKVEDTIKKSREILCAAHNIKYPDHPLAQDDKSFVRPSELIVGLERLILETIGFDFRVRYPQKVLIKTVRKLLPPEDAREFLAVAYDMSIDIYKSFAPIKQTTFTTVMAVVELTALLTRLHLDKIRSLDLHRWHTNRGCVMETMLDLLDLYAQFQKSTKIGQRFPQDKFINVKIGLNKELDASNGLTRYETYCPQCQADVRDIHPITPGSATSPATTSSYPGSSTVKRTTKSTDATMRFVFDEDEARREQDTVSDFFRDEYEEYEIEVEEQIPETEHNHSRPGQSRHQNNNHDHGWAPYHRNRHGHPNDRYKGRKGHGGYR
ncbi:Cyclin-like protein [Coniochaeta hoffmannii]|uniref:RNA polymerase II holoenzyme cyclin-like subunit n=1 Tax=Coniochaeta hoffmannii TaxID=91930 RepID=A0AA38VHM8_9PEZI|nr:Cyclin-like protein [Coniochaeta hoffmannii]